MDPVALWSQFSCFSIHGFTVLQFSLEWFRSSLTQTSRGCSAPVFLICTAQLFPQSIFFRKATSSKPRSLACNCQSVLASGSSCQLLLCAVCSVDSNRVTDLTDDPQINGDWFFIHVLAQPFSIKPLIRSQGACNQIKASGKLWEFSYFSSKDLCFLNRCIGLWRMQHIENSSYVQYYAIWLILWCMQRLTTYCTLRIWSFRSLVIKSWSCSKVTLYKIEINQACTPCGQMG